MPAKVVHRHHQTAEFDLRPTVLLGAVPLLELEQVVADVLPLALLDPDGDAGVGVVEVDAVVKPLMRPELAVRVVAAGGVPLILVLPRARRRSRYRSRRPPCVSSSRRRRLLGRPRRLPESTPAHRPEIPRTRFGYGARSVW
ncbi:hypothetical protein D320_03496 [Haloferax sp. BAB-2207]|nr:hypothetical protein D320_03496 [Haloferax sp. BAB-2207]